MSADALPPLTGGARRRWIAVAAWVVASIIVTIAFRFVSRGDALAHIRRAHPAWLVCAVVLNGLILVIWGALWHTLLPSRMRVPLRRLVEITSLTSMVLNTLPFLVGEASAVVLLARRAKLGAAAALSLLAIDQLLLGIAKIVLLLLVALLVPLPPWMRRGLAGLALGVGALLVLLLVAARHGRLPREEITRGAPSRTSRVWRAVAEWAHGLEGLRSWRRFSAALVLEFAKKGAELAAIVAVQAAFGHAMPVADALLVLAALNLVTVLPVSPGNLGVYEAAVYVSYRYLGVPTDDALGMALVQHLCYLVPLVGTGYIILSVQQMMGRGTAAAA